jgi:type IV secretory pathway component VirB8
LLQLSKIALLYQWALGAIMFPQQEHQKLAWLCRLLMIYGGIVTFFAIVLIVALMMVFPLKQPIPMLVTAAAKSDQVVLIEPIQRSSKGVDLLLETLARQYVLLREPLDFQTESLRWSQLAYFSSSDLMHYFRQQMDSHNPKSPYVEFQRQGVIRQVNILSSASLTPSAPNVWQVEWESVDRDAQTNELLARQVWISTLTASCIEQETVFKDQYLNPVGFTVSHYRVAAKHENT